MAQTPQSEETRSGDGTTAAEQGRPQGLFGSSTTILLLIFAVAVFWWSRRRRVEMEERLRAQRREAEETAERSALDVAHLMRAAPQPGAAAAAASEGLASAAGQPPAQRPLTSPGAQLDPDAGAIERAEAQAAAERVAEEQAALASHKAETAGESAIRRDAAAAAAAKELQADAADAQRAAWSAPAPMGAIAGDGTTICPPDYPIKGNRQSRIYHRPGQSSYASTVAEYCFSSVEAAEVAGFRASRARGQRVES
jgi:hypothetical protein